ncbi:MAG TPA: hypothetical protein VIT85_04200 [Solirubrobacterales bacterium]
MRRALAAVAATGMLAAAAGVAAQAEVVTGGNARVSFHGRITPNVLPRVKPAPVALAVSGTVRPIGDGRPAGIRRVEIAINRHGVVSTRGLPTCKRRRVLSSTTGQALAACGDALVGSGHFRAHIDIPEQSPFPASGRMLAFNAVVGGRHVLLAHVFGTRPAPNSEVLVMRVRREESGQFGSTLIVKMPNVGNEWGYVTGFDLTLEREYRYRGRPRSFLSASCPAPEGVREAPFRAARGTFFLSEGKPVTQIVAGHCRVAPG